MTSCPTHIHPDWLGRQSVQSLIALLNQHAIPFRFVGGCVRNALLNLPVADIDAATPCRPEQVMSLLQKAGVKVLPTGLAHGTVTVLMDKDPIEITTLRRDEACDGRHAEVTFTDDWAEDAKRRDFTMNAVYCDGDGKLYDDVGGIQDALHGIVRFIGDPYQRIHEDYLRILRFFRFYAYYGQAPIDQAGLKVSAELASNLTKLSGERIQAELFKILQASRYLEVVNLLIDYHILDSVLLISINAKEIITNIDKQVQKLPDNILKTIDNNLTILRLGAIATPGIDQAKIVAHRLKLSREDAVWFKLVLNPPVLITQRDWYHYIHFKGQASALMVYLIQAARHQTKADPAIFNLILNWQDKPFPLRGQDLVDNGLKPGPDVSKWLKELEIWWLDQDRISDREEILSHFDKFDGSFSIRS